MTKPSAPEGPWGWGFAFCPARHWLAVLPPFSLAGILGMPPPMNSEQNLWKMPTSLDDVDAVVMVCDALSDKMMCACVVFPVFLSVADVLPSAVNAPRDRRLVL